MNRDDVPISAETEQLKEKIRLKKLDRGAYINEVEQSLAKSREKRNALRIGNECLRYMTLRQEKMPTQLNADIFAKHPNDEKLVMQKTNLQDSIYQNDSKLFKTGKSLLKEDYEHEKMRQLLSDRKLELERAGQSRELHQQDREEKCHAYLHKQAMVADSNHRVIVAKLIYQRLQQVKKELDEDVSTYPQRLRDIERRKALKATELADFEELRARGERFLNLELYQLEPLDEELNRVTNHFVKTIAQERNELDDRRKKSSLVRFITDRDTNWFNFNESTNLMDTKVRARDNALDDAFDTLTSLMDAMMVSDVRYVVDCILDQADVTKMLIEEKQDTEDRNLDLLERLRRLAANNKYQKYNDKVKAMHRQKLSEAKAMEREVMKQYEICDEAQRKLDRLMSALNVSMHALFEKLRPIKIEEAFNNFHGDLVKDIQNLNKKVEKMTSIINSSTLPIPSVRPLMLHLFKNKRLPPDSIRVDLENEFLKTAMQTYDFYEMDQPGYVSRDYLKARAAQAGGSGKKRGKKGGRRK